MIFSPCSAFSFVSAAYSEIFFASPQITCDEEDSYSILEFISSEPSETDFELSFIILL